MILTNGSRLVGPLGASRVGYLTDGDTGTIIRLDHYTGIPSPVVHWDQDDEFIDRGGTKRDWLQVIHRERSPLEQLAEVAE